MTRASFGSVDRLHFVAASTCIGAGRPLFGGAAGGGLFVLKRVIDSSAPVIACFRVMFPATSMYPAANTALAGSIGCMWVTSPGFFFCGGAICGGCSLFGSVSLVRFLGVIVLGACLLDARRIFTLLAFLTFYFIFFPAVGFAICRGGIFWGTWEGLQIRADRRQSPF